MQNSEFDNVIEQIDNAEKIEINSFEEADQVLLSIKDATNTLKIKEEEFQNRKIELEKLFKPQIDRINKFISESNSSLEEFANRNKEAVGKKYELSYGTIGFRIGKPALSFLKGWTEEKIKNAMLKVKDFAKFRRITVAIDKQGIINSRLDNKVLKKIGVEVNQAEKFFVELK